ncbi:MAG: hypothetical protein AAGJ54_07115 [Planctomycetota bacterium]
MNRTRTLSVTLAALAACMANAQVVRSGAAADAAGLEAVVNQFRDDLGQLNANEPGSVGSGRRQINWDAAPDAVSAPNPFAGEFFNADFNPRARGIEFTTPGTGFQLSATAASGQGERFANINAAYADQFSTFSPERLFTAIDSNIIDVQFFIPGTQQRATTRGFGAVFTDVDLAGSSFIEYFDLAGNLLGSYDAEAGPTENGSLSFVGVSFDEAIIGSVRIYAGNQALGGLESGSIDLVALDDFIFGEPVPTPGTVAVASASLIAFRRRRRS